MPECVLCHCYFVGTGEICPLCDRGELGHAQKKEVLEREEKQTVLTGVF